MSTSNLDFLHTLEAVIQKRRSTPVEGSYTSHLLEAGDKRIAQKVGEEAVELALASVERNREESVNEAADLLYHVLVLLNNQDMTLSDVVAVLEQRHVK